MRRPATADCKTLNDFTARFAASGSRPALIAFSQSDSRSISYAELGEEIERTASGLAARGLGPGSRIALWAPNSAEWVIAYFAIVRAGAVAVPLDQQAAPEQLASMLAHAQPDLLLTTATRLADLRRAASGAAPPALLLEDGAPAAGWLELRAGERRELPAVDAEHPAALLYTSGTTGTPKGVLLTHGNLAANATALISAGLIGGADRVLLPLPLHHTYPFTVGLLMPLGIGATVIFPAGISGPDLGRAGGAGRATALVAVPRLCEALWDSVAANVASRGKHAQRLFFALLGLSIAVRRATGRHLGKWLFRSLHRRLGPDIRLIGCGGAKLSERLAWRLEGLGWTVRTGYGLTETSPVVTFNSPRASHLGAEGRPLPGVEVRIEQRGADRIGEVVVRGPSVFSGYVGNDAATAAAFTPDGWFRTGDLGRIDSRGFLHIVGRSKELLVLADGKKVFPEDIEKRYSSDLLREVAILERDGALVALIVPDEDTLRKRGALREAALLRETIEDTTAKLPPYQRITDYRVVRAPLPRTQLGKLKRHLLPALYREAAAGERPAAAALTPEDRALLASERGRAVWAWLTNRFPERALTLETSPQLDLGIDSLTWVALTIEIEQRFHAALDGDAVSRVLTLRDLLREIERAAAAPARAHRSPEAEFVPQGLLLRAIGAALYCAVRVLMRVAFRLDVDGSGCLPSDAPFVIAPNHASYLDPLAVAAALPWRQLRRTYWAGWVGVMYAGPITSFVSRASRVLPLDPDRDLASAIDTARAALRHGYSIVWFPEGRRSPSGKLGPFLPGVGQLLAGSGAPAVPTAIRGTFEAWPKHRRLPRLGSTIRVTFGEPRTSARLDAAARGADAISMELEAAVRELLDDTPGATPPAHARARP